MRLTGAFLLVELAGSAALLLWGVHMVQSGLLRAFGPALRRHLGAVAAGRLRGFFAGVAVTALLQSSTAVALIVSGFCAAGFLTLAPALAIMLGANVGTTLIVQVLAFDIARAAPALVVIGVVLFRAGGRARLRDLGRVALGLGLMLMALAQMLAAIEPVEKAQALRVVMAAVSPDPLINILIAALLAWLAHSSVAIVLLIMSLFAHAVVPFEAALALTLGANLGTAINPVLEGARSGDADGRRVALGNLLTRLAAVALALPFLGDIAAGLPRLAGGAHGVALFHTLFNLAAALAFLPLLGPIARLLQRLVPPAPANERARPRHLDSAVLASPAVALGGANREALRMTDLLEDMLRRAREALEGDDRGHIQETRRLDDDIDALHLAIGAYVAQMRGEKLDDADESRLQRLLAMTTNIEHAGDILERDVMSTIGKRLKRGVAFPAELGRSLGDIFERLLANLRLAAAVFAGADMRAAHLLASEKENFRARESEASAIYFSHVRAHDAAQAEAAALYLDLVRDLKRINDHLVSAAAYPLLEESGALLQTRLRET